MEARQEGPAAGKRRYKHAKTVVALLVIACVLAPIAGTSIWIKNQVTKTDRYVRTVKPLVLAVVAVVVMLAIEVLGRASGPAEYGTPRSAT